MSLHEPTPKNNNTKTTNSPTINYVHYYPYGSFALRMVIFNKLCKDETYFPNSCNFPVYDTRKYEFSCFEIHHLR